MSDTNIFADATNVGQLFDALWYNAASVVENGKKQEAQDHPRYLQRAREIAIGDAHKRYEELTSGNS